MNKGISINRGQIRMRLLLDLAELSTGAIGEGVVLADALIEYIGPKMLFPYSVTIGIWQLSMNLDDEALKRAKTQVLIGINKPIPITVTYKDLSKNIRQDRFNSLG